MSVDYNVYLPKFSNMLSELQHIWDGHLGLIKAAKHQIEISSAGEHLIQSALYKAGQHTQELEKHKIDKMLATDIIEPAQTKGPHPSCLSPRKMERSDFV